MKCWGPTGDLLAALLAQSTLKKSLMLRSSKSLSICSCGGFAVPRLECQNLCAPIFQHRICYHAVGKNLWNQRFCGIKSDKSLMVAYLSQGLPTWASLTLITSTPNNLEALAQFMEQTHNRCNNYSEGRKNVGFLDHLTEVQLPYTKNETIWMLETLHRHSDSTFLCCFLAEWQLVLHSVVKKTPSV